jgi:DNA-binding NtrC family response regulator
VKIVVEKTALVIDDDPNGRDLLCGKLRDAGFEVRGFGDAYLALEYLRENPPDLVVTDHFLPGMLGAQFVKRVREFSDVPIIGLSARASVVICDDMHRAGAQRFLSYADAVEGIASIASQLLQSASESAPLMTVSVARGRHDRDERIRFSSLVAAFDGNISAIARHMGVDRSTVQYHLTRLGLR